MKMNGLKVNQAILSIHSDSSIYKPFGVYSQSAECENCDLKLNHEMHPGNTWNLTVDTRFPTRLSLLWKENLQPVCKGSLERHFYGNQHCTLNVNNDTDIPDGRNCSYQCTTLGEDPYLPILWALLVYLGIALLWLFGKTIYKYNFFRSSDSEHLIVSDLGSPDDPNVVLHLSVSEPSSSISNLTTARRRLRSLDTFRGLCLALMIFVNYGGGKYWFFAHSTWNGVTFADVVFPWFMWIMGVSTTLSVHSLLRRATPKWRIFWKIVTRAVILFVLGLVVNTIDGFEYSTLRVMGVLQRFSVTYFVVATLELLFARMNDTHLVTWWAPIRDVLVYWPQWLFMLLVVVSHTLITFLLPVPGCPTGYLGPGGLHDHKNYANCTGGASGYIDRLILGEEHIYPRPSCKKIYATGPYDPEGILGILTSAFLVFLGLQAGKILIFHVSDHGRLYRWLSWGIVTGTIGTVLCKAEKNSDWIPLNKNLWSLSFILVLAGLAFILLSILYVIIDVKRLWSGAPFYQPGMNSILLYVGHEFSHGVFPWGWNGCLTHSCFLSQSLWGTSLWVLIAVILYRKKWFLAI